MKMRMSIILALLLAFSSFTNVFAYQYEFELDYDENIIFGKPTETLVEPDYSHIENTRKNKDGSYLPPGYAVFSGEIPTDKASKYHEYDRIQATVYQYDKGLNNIPDATQSIFYPAGTNDISVSYTDYTAQGAAGQRITQVNPFEDGSIGRLTIPSIGVNVKVREGTDQNTLKNAIGHFEFTSQWTGLIGLAAHNRGSASYFGEIKKLEMGDTIKYETTLGTREYAVFYKEKISDTDFTNLVDTAENTLCLITCVENQPNLRWCVMAREI